MSRCRTMPSANSGCRNGLVGASAAGGSAGGVDAFLIGSELKSLTRVRSGSGVYPAVNSTNSAQQYRMGHDFLGSVYVPDPGEDLKGALTAYDPMTGEQKWSFPYYSNPYGGALSTAGGVVFAGDSDGNFIALDARTGKDLWHVQVGAALYSAAITYKLDDRQYVSIPAGSALFTFALPEK